MDKKFIKDSDPEMKEYQDRNIGVRPTLIPQPDGTYKAGIPSFSQMNKGHENNLVHLAFFDVLGFSEKVKSIGLQRIYEIYEDLISIVEKYNGKHGYIEYMEGRPTDFAIFIGARYEKGEDGKDYTPYWATFNVDHYYFSDTVMLWAPWHPKVASIFLRVCSDFFCEAIKHELPLRGCIGYGRVVFDTSRNIFLGEPLVDCAKGETAQNWVGATLSSNILSPCGVNEWQKYAIDPVTLLPFTGQFKKDKHELLTPFALDWPKLWRMKFKDSAIEALKKINTEPLFSHYYENAIQFVQLSEQCETDWRSLPKEKQFEMWQTLYESTGHKM
jgi:hypothetical protein